VVNSSNGVKNLTVEQSSVTRSCSRKVHHVSPEITKQPEELRIPREGVTQRTAFVAVVSPNALHGQIKPVLDEGGGTRALR